MYTKNRFDEGIDMVNSMTGYGYGEIQQNGLRVCIEVKSLNHKFLDISMRMPRHLNSIEIELRKIISDRFKRGRFDVAINIKDENGILINIGLELKKAKKIYDQLRELKENLLLPGEITLSDMLSFKDYMKTDEAFGLEEIRVVYPVDRALNLALDNLMEMRIQEGKEIFQQLNVYCDTVENIVHEISLRISEDLGLYKNKLIEKIKSITQGLEIDDSRIAQELAIIVEKSDISEEINRLKSHISQFRMKLTNNVEAVGKTLDFIVQEMSREINTIASKSQSIEISNKVIETKGILEKMKEQICNVE